jgi:2-polyprenyl-6-methoxyphenol hydroxylase-like FAD-dependent oxidoreductase
MSIEDAAALARHVGPLLAAGEPAQRLAAPLLAYERERQPANEALIRWSHWMSCCYAFEGPLATKLRRQVFALGATRFGQRVQQHMWTRMATRSVAA